MYFVFNLSKTSDPYVRIDLVAANGDEVIDSVMTKTKRRVTTSTFKQDLKDINYHFY